MNTWLVKNFPYARTRGRADARTPKDRPQDLRDLAQRTEDELNGLESEKEVAWPLDSPNWYTQFAHGKHHRNLVEWLMIHSELSWFIG